MCKRALIRSIFRMIIKINSIIFLIQPIAIVMAGESLVSVSALNNSYNTLCAEEDNINVPFIGEADSVIIRATHPSSYQVENFTCNENFTDCDFDDNEEFEFENPSEDIKLYDDGEIYLLATRQATWWRSTGMQVWVDDDDYEKDVHYIEIGQKIEGVNQWPIYFVLYEDGNVRLIPQPQENVSDICFGSSVIIGSAEVSNRPYADIESLHFVSSSKTLEITYSNGELFNIELESVNRKEAVIKVKVNERNDSEIPFITFRSMFVTVGNADVDAVELSNADDETLKFNILSFTEDKSPNWFFFRGTSSQHNQSAPDIEITFYQNNDSDYSSNSSSCFIESLIGSMGQ